MTANLSPHEISERVSKMIVDAIMGGNCTVIFDSTSKIRLIGYENGELFLGLRCKYIHLGDKSQTDPKSGP